MIIFSVKFKNKSIKAIKYIVLTITINNCNNIFTDHVLYLHISDLPCTLIKINISSLRENVIDQHYVSFINAFAWISFVDRILTIINRLIISFLSLTVALLYIYLSLYSVTLLHFLFGIVGSCLFTHSIPHYLHFPFHNITRCSHKNENWVVEIISTQNCWF